MDRTYLTFNKFEEETSDSFSTAHRNSSHNSFGTASSPVLNSPDHNSDTLSDNSKKIRKKRSTYQKIDDATRMRLLDAVQQGETLKAAAKRQGINYSSAKSILHTYRKEGRIFKKSAQERVAKKRTKNSSDLEMSPIYPYKQFQGYNDSTEAPMYGSLDLQQNGLYRNDLNEEPSGRTGTNGVTINSFGDFLKVDSQGRAKSDNSFTSSTITLKLDSQKFQRLPANSSTNSAPVPTLVPVLNATPAPSNQQVTSNSRNIQTGNWQLNVNIHSENPQKAARSLSLKETPQFTYTFNTKAPENPQRPESFTMNFSTTARKDAPEYDSRFVNRRYDGANEMIAAPENNHYAPEEQNYDVSCFLNSSSPAYSFPQKTTEVEPISATNTDNIPGFLENHDLYSKNKEGGNYLNNFGLKLEQRTPEMMKTASLRSY